VWAIAFKWYSLTGGDNGLIGIPVPSALADPRALYLFTVAIVVLVGGLLWRLVNAPFGRTLLAVRENAERAEFVAFTSGVSSSPPSSSRVRCRDWRGRCSPCSARRFP